MYRLCNSANGERYITREIKEHFTTTNCCYILAIFLSVSYDPHYHMTHTYTHTHTQNLKLYESVDLRNMIVGNRIPNNAFAMSQKKL